jgi:hypothetical protein
MITKLPTEKEFRGILRGWFGSNGFNVDDVPRETSGERADQLVYDQSVRVLLELKIKGESEAEEAQRNSVLNKRGIHRNSEASVRRNQMSALISKGVSQLTHTPIAADFNVIWLHGAGRYCDHHQTRFIATLYGRRWLIEIPGPGARWCYYFDNSDFFRRRYELAAAVVSYGEECILCINDLHPSADSFRRSSFRALFNDSYIDPPEAETKNEAYIAPSEIGRGDPAAMLTAVAHKYNVQRLIDFTPTMHIAEARVDEKPREQQ